MRGRWQTIVAVGGALLAPMTLAATQPQAVDLGAFKFIPEITVSQSHNDNIYYQSTGEKSSWITNFQPLLQLMTQKDDDMFALTYQGDYAVYATSSQDDYNDHTLSADAVLVANTWNNFKLGASYAKLHDNRGQGSSEGTIALSRPEPDKYDATQASGTWNFGADQARFSASLTANTLDISYKNNRIETQFRDRTNNGVDLTGYVRISGKTKLFAEYGQTDIKYDHLPLFGGTLDSTEKSTYFGATWEITGKTTGTAKFGQVAKEFDDPAKVNQDVTAWQAQLIWQPRTYSTVTVMTSRAPRETNGTGYVIESNTNQITWQHDWRSDVHTTFSAGFGKDSYAGNPRIDHLSNYSASIDMDVYRWLNVGADFRHTKRTSQYDPQFAYDQNIWGVNFTVSL